MYKEVSVKFTNDVQGKIIRRLDSMPNLPLWSEFEDNIIKTYYGKKRTTDIAKVLNRPFQQITGRALKLKLI